jgi:DNA helicase HerA-like ATPase
MSKIQIQVGDRWAIIGGTGSGKTTFDKYLLKFYYAAGLRARRLFPIYILDTKISGDFAEFHHKSVGHYHFGNEVPKLINPMKDGRPFLVWQPEEDDIDMYDAFLKQVYQARQPAIVLIDELGSLTNANATKFPRYYDILLKQGRGLHIGMISNTQSPAYIPPNLIRQTTHLLRFRLNDQYDAKKLAKQLGREYGEEWEPEHEHGFVYRNCTKPRKSSPPIYYKDLQEFFGLSK